MSRTENTDLTNVQNFGLKARYLDILGKLRERAAKRAIYRQKVTELQAFSDRDLADFGYHRSEIPRIVKKAVGLT